MPVSNSTESLIADQGIADTPVIDNLAAAMEDRQISAVFAAAILLRCVDFRAGADHRCGRRSTLRLGAALPWINSAASAKIILVAFKHRSPEWIAAHPSLSYTRCLAVILVSASGYAR